MATRWFDAARNTLVTDFTRPQAAPSDTNLSTGYATGDLLANAADAWIDTRTRNMWRLVYFMWILIAAACGVWYQQVELDGWFVVTVGGAAGVAFVGCVVGSVLMRSRAHRRAPSRLRSSARQ